MAQISLNLTDSDQTPLHVVYEEVCVGGESGTDQQC